MRDPGVAVEYALLGHHALSAVSDILGQVGGDCDTEVLWRTRRGRVESTPRKRNAL